MDKIVIERNGVRHALVSDSDLEYCDDGCSLLDLCVKRDICLCRIMGCVNGHFEIEKVK